MRQFLYGVACACLVLFVIQLSVSDFGLTPVAEAQKADRKITWRETDAGVVPTSFGELVTINGSNGSYTLVFQNSEKEIRIIDLRGSKLPVRAMLVRRVY